MNTKKLLLLGLTTLAAGTQITTAQDLTDYQFECTKTFEIAQQLVQEIETHPFCWQMIYMTDHHQIVIDSCTKPITIDITDTIKLQELFHTLHRISKQIDTLFSSYPFNSCWERDENLSSYDQHLSCLQDTLSHSLKNYQYIIVKNIEYINVFIAMSQIYNATVAGNSEPY